MPLRTLLRFRNPDVSSDLNHRLRDLVTKGIYSGGQVLPVAATLNVSVTPFGSIGADGMVTLLEGASETLTCTVGITQWVLLHAYYVANDTPVAVLEVLSETAYDALSVDDKERRIKLAQVTLGSAATEVESADISYVESDRIDAVARSSFRGSVDTVTSLPDYSDPPDGITTQNRNRDVYFVADQSVFFAWTTDGTPRWIEVVSTADELALANHKNNFDDGTVPPELYNAQHVLVKHRESLDEGTASLALHGSEGTDFGTGNAVMDEAFPETKLSRIDVTGLTAATKFQITGTVYVGTGLVDTADPHFRIAEYQSDNLLAVSGEEVLISEIRRSDDAAELNPSLHADALGYYADPYIVIDTAVTGNLSVYCRERISAGSRLPGDESLADIGLGFSRHAREIPVVGSGFSHIPTTVDDVQEAVGELDETFGTLSKIVNVAGLSNGPDPDELNWYGGTAAAVGTASLVGSEVTIEALGSRDLVLKAHTNTSVVLGSGGNIGFADASSPATDIHVDRGTANVGVRIQLEHDGAATGTNYQYASLNLVTKGDGTALGSATNQGWYVQSFADSYDVAAYRNDLRMAYWDGATTSTVLRCTPSGRVGLGTDPANQLHILSSDPTIRLDDSDASGHALILTNNNSDLYLSADPTDADAGTVIGFTVDGSRKMTIGADGDVGIGIQDADCRLHVFDGSAGTVDSHGSAHLTIESSLSNNYLQFLSPDNSLQGILFGGESDNDQGKLQYYLSSDQFEFFGGGSTMMFLADSGMKVLGGLHVGANTTPYDNDITLVGGINAGGTANPGVGDGIFTSGLAVGYDAAPADDSVTIGDANFGLLISGGDPTIKLSSTRRFWLDSGRLYYTAGSDNILDVLSNQVIIKPVNGTDYTSLSITPYGGVVIDSNTDGGRFRLPSQSGVSGVDENGTMVYDSSTNKLTVRINGAWHTVDTTAV